MKKMTSQELYTKKKGGQFLIEINSGDVFFSFHHNDNCAGVFITKGEVTTANLEKVFKVVADYFGDVKACEVKIIANLRLIEKVSLFLESKSCTYFKKIEKKDRTEIVFLPEMNKVRVAIESAQPVQQKSTPFREVKKEKYKILIVDDSKTIRNILNRIFSSDPMFEVCAMAEKPSEVDALIQKHKPDLITLDIHMPEMDGVELLKIIAPKYKIPTIMISSISMAEGPLVLEALENGAIDYIQKPEMTEIEKVTPMIIEKAKAAVHSKATIQSRNSKAPKKTNEKCNLDSLIVLGSSTGGTEAIRDILTALPDQIPPMLIVQHIPAVFSAAFAKRMNDLCKFEVKEAANGDEVIKNRVLIAPGGTQMKMIHKNGKTFVEINDDEPVNRFKPSVDYMFFSVAKSLYTNTVAVILTGMGKDGAKGMLELKRQGVRTIAQDEFTSVVFGMPKEAINIGAADFVEPLPEIAERLTMLTQQPAQKKLA
jgi:two-component system chemotaxis response regulator CheB